MSPLRRALFAIYLAAAIVGAIIPYAIMLPALSGGLIAFFAGAGANPGALMFAADLIISATVFLPFAIVDGRRADMTNLWIYPLVAILVGLSCAFPLFLAMRERALTAQQGAVVD